MKITFPSLGVSKVYKGKRPIKYAWAVVLKNEPGKLFSYGYSTSRKGVDQALYRFFSGREARNSDTAQGMSMNEFLHEIVEL